MVMTLTFVVLSVRAFIGSYIKRGTRDQDLGIPLGKVAANVGSVRRKRLWMALLL